MANYYVWSGATGGGTGADWANAYITLQAALTARLAGDVFFVAHDHVQTQATALTITAPGTEVNRNKVYCVNRAGSVPPVNADLRTTAQVLTTGASTISVGGSADWFGIIFSSGDGTSNSSMNLSAVANRSCRHVNCAFILAANNTNGRIACGSLGALTTLENCTFKFSHTGQAIIPMGRLVLRNTETKPFLDPAGVIPTSTMAIGTVMATFFCEGIDFSSIGAGKSIFTATTSTPAFAVMKDCKLGAGSLTTGAIAGIGGFELTLIRCDTGDTNYRTEKYAYAGTQTIETTIVHSGGASDGTTPIAWKLVNTSAAQPRLESLPISVWNEVVGTPVTVTVEGIWGGGATPLNDEIWIDVQYLGTSGFPLDSKASSAKLELATAANLPAGSGTWGGSTTKFKMSATFTPQEKGPLTIYVTAAKTSTTFYIDPKPVIT